jgi:hypothetical protein
MTAHTAALLLAVPEDKVSPGALGFVIVLALGVALYLLIRSMNKQIARIEAPREDELKQADWERRRQEEAGRRPPNGGDGDAHPS